MNTDTHKGGRGKVLIIGGADGMAGAVRYAGGGAFSAGAGLVRMLTSSNSAAALQEQFADATVETSALGPEPEDAVYAALDWCDAVVIGPGLGRGDDRSAFVGAVLSSTSKPVVVDADALHTGAEVCLTGDGPRILTPHAGEFQALFPALDPADRFVSVPAALATMKRTGNRATILLKGVPTIVAGGGVVGSRVVATGNPGLATGGSGDVLSGIVGALCARGVHPLQAASLGAYVLGRAADIAVEPASVTTLRPADVVAAMSAVWRELELGGKPSWPTLLTLDPPALT